MTSASFFASVLNLPACISARLRWPDLCKLGTAAK